MEEKKVLFLVGSVYQLFNAITLRMTECKDCHCDLLMNMMTKWNPEMLLRLSKSGIFESVHQVDTSVIDERFWKQDNESRKEIVDNPNLFFDQIPISPVYDEFFVAKEHLSWKILYRYQVLSGKKTRVVMFEEGIRSYTLDLKETDMHPYMQGDYSKTRFTEAVYCYYLYQPDLYALKNYDYELRQLPNPEEHPVAKKALLEVFGYEEMPQEPYIYLEDYFFADHYITNDFDLFKKVVSVVGAENIVTKRHPRDLYDRFLPLGYKTVENSVIPWEMQLLENDLRLKVLVSVSSTSILTPFIIFNSDMHVVSLEKMFVGDNPVHKDAAFRTFFDKMVKKINQDTVHFHMPSSIGELKEVLRYIKLVQTVNEQRLASI